ncbi:unnamed protein product [Adineta steineri]|uniref:Uncharacterized protein n=2 Tax=Adineta steineri TaxID=433720 RepID=A0A815TRD1_9BILA|nr:unnamed protein product [Adineta steineri]CAF1455533.1 unnamed protein product [Adineta steineri]CAF1506506.1 unnamed protein product [Adineta steineri]CAF3820093.1 unnamed protein product [Adineta steineri]CAF3901797.1 unnamed protein product [Adineta steineri]
MDQLNVVDIKQEIIKCFKQLEIVFAVYIEDTHLKNNRNTNAMVQKQQQVVQLIGEIGDHFIQQADYNQQLLNLYTQRNQATKPKEERK